MQGKGAHEGLLRLAALVEVLARVELVLLARLAALEIRELLLRDTRLQVEVEDALVNEVLCEPKVEQRDTVA